MKKKGLNIIIFAIIGVIAVYAFVYWQVVINKPNLKEQVLGKWRVIEVQQESRIINKFNEESLNKEDLLIYDIGENNLIITDASGNTAIPCKWISGDSYQTYDDDERTKLWATSKLSFKGDTLHMSTTNVTDKRPFEYLLKKYHEPIDIKIPKK